MIKKLLAAIVTVSVVAISLGAPAIALDPFPPCTAGATSSVCTAQNDKLFGPNSIWTRILDTFTFVIGSISVLVIIIGGIRYVTSGGDQAGITSAKNTILYAVIGVIIAMMAYGIVHFVVSNI
jgi:hypothetical protein